MFIKHSELTELSDITELCELSEKIEGPPFEVAYTLTINNK